ncbi:hypothetical protein D3C85_783150 [compost metagenome]
MSTIAVRKYTLYPATTGFERTVLRVASFQLEVAPSGPETVRGGRGRKYIQPNVDGDFITLRNLVTKVLEVAD